MYTNYATRKHPGLVVLMIDQSGSMAAPSKANDKPLAVIAADSINLVLTEMVSIATKQVGDDDEEVRDYQKVVIIGYGGEPNTSAQLLYEGYHSDIVNRYKKERVDSINGPVDIFNVVKPVAGYVTPMAAAFEMAKQHINMWKSEGRDGKEDPSPIVINITDGAPSDGEGYCTKEAFTNTAKEAHEIMKISFADGFPRIFNILISQLDGNEVRFPDDANALGEDPFAQFLFSISSNVTKDLLDKISEKGLGNANVNSKILMMNVNNPNVLVSILRMGTLAKMR